MNAILSGVSAGGMVVWLPDSLAGAELRQQRYPCPLGPLCNYGGGGLQQRGMVITNAETGEVVHDSRPAAPHPEHLVRRPIGAAA